MTLRWKRASRPRSRVAILLCLLCSAAFAAESDDVPTAAVKRALEQAGKIGTSSGDRAAELQALREVARNLVDTRAMGRRTIGSVLDTRPDAEQAEFLRLFDELIIRAYLQKLLLFKNPKYRFGREERRDDTAIVHTEVLAGEDAYAVDYEMHRQGDRWLATDIVVEGVSLNKNYADQFDSVLKNRSFEELLDLMRRKVQQFQGGEKS